MAYRSIRFRNCRIQNSDARLVFEERNFFLITPLLRAPPPHFYTFEAPSPPLPHFYLFPPPTPHISTVFHPTPPPPHFIVPPSPPHTHTHIVDTHYQHISIVLHPPPPPQLFSLHHHLGIFCSRLPANNYFEINAKNIDHKNLPPPPGNCLLCPPSAQNFVALRGGYEYSLKLHISKKAELKTKEGCHTLLLLFEIKGKEKEKKKRLHTSNITNKKRLHSEDGKGSSRSARQPKQLDNQSIEASTHRLQS